MTDDTQPPARERSKAPAEPTHYWATLVNGITYSVNHKGDIYRFKGRQPKSRHIDPEPVKIPASLKVYLEETALDTVTVNRGGRGGRFHNEGLNKFEFQPVEG